MVNEPGSCTDADPGSLYNGSLYVRHREGKPVRIIKKLMALLYLLAAVVSLGGMAAWVYSPYARRLTMLFYRYRRVVPIVLAVCLGITALGVLIGFCRLFFTRREPKCVRIEGNADIEVSLAALESCASRAAAEDEDVLIERVEGRIVGSDQASARFKIDAIALVDDNLNARAQAMQRRVEDACGTMLGVSEVSARVRFLPSRTTVQVREVSDE